MKKRQERLGVLLVPLLALLVVPYRLESQDPNRFGGGFGPRVDRPLPDLPAGERLRVVEMELVIEDGEVLQVSIKEGSAGTLHTPQYTLALVPRVIDAAGGEVELRVVHLPGGQERGPARASEPMPVLVKEGIPAPLAHFPIEVQVVDIRHAEPAQAATVAPISLDEVLLFQEDVTAAANCCVTCGSVTLCGCKVSMRCGFCCVDCCNLAK